MNYYYNVVIGDDCQFPSNQLVFTFSSLNEALKFTKKILETSDYCISILKLEDNDNE